MRAQPYRSVITPTAILLLLMARAAMAQSAPFAYVSQSVVYDPSTGQVNFSMEFNQPPDFAKLDMSGSNELKANSFQHYIVGQPGLGFPNSFDSIIRGDEIDLTLDRLPIRNAVPESSDPAAHGWGSIRGYVPFVIDDDLLTFSAPLSLLSDHSTDGRFLYDVQSLQDGADTRFEANLQSVVPEPTMPLLLATSLAALTYRTRKR
jgi:hypothetical protein